MIMITKPSWPVNTDIIAKETKICVSLVQSVVLQHPLLVMQFFAQVYSKYVAVIKDVSQQEPRNKILQQWMEWSNTQQIEAQLPDEKDRVCKHLKSQFPSAHPIFSSWPWELTGTKMVGSLALVKVSEYLPTYLGTLH